MKKRASATLIGLFVVGGLGMVAAAIIFVAGNEIFTRKERAVMHFSGSIYGLQVGAPVVFRGVRIGSVTSIDVLYDKVTDSFSIPVDADLERNAVHGMDGKRTRDDPALALPALVERGLQAQLSMQSLLTGLLYVDLDLRPEKVAQVHGSHNSMVEIPTSATAIQNLKNQLDGLDFRRLLEDVAAIAGSARTIAAGPQIKQALDDLAEITGNVKRLSARLDQRVDPLATNLQSTLAGARSAIDRLGGAAESVRNTAASFDTTAQNLSALVAADSVLVRNVQQSAAEVARTATALRQSTGADSDLARNSERALQDVSRAARALRELAEMLERNPETLLRGKPAGP